jgi:rRNA maturation endonuclease Nob1
MAIVSMGAYEAMFIKSRSAPLMRELNKNFKPFLKCIHCESAIKINRKNAPGMYIKDQLICDSCGLQSAFPFYWLMNQAKASVTSDSERPKNLKKKKG